MSTAARLAELQHLRGEARDLALNELVRVLLTDERRSSIRRLRRAILDQNQEYIWIGTLLDMLDAELGVL